MADTYTQIYIHIVFAVRNREHLIRGEFREELQKYITGIVSGQGQKLIAIYCMPDHAHILVGIKPDMAVSDIVKFIKTGSTNHVNASGWFEGRFSWQDGFGAFSCSHSQLEKVINYIRNQEKHHAGMSYRDEYLRLLEKNDVEFDEKYALDV